MLRGNTPRVDFYQANANHEDSDDVVFRRYVPVPTVEQLAVGAEVDFFWGNEADMHSGVCDHKWKPGTLVVLGADSSTVDVRHQVNPGAPGHVTKGVNLSRIRLLQQYRELARPDTEEDLNATDTADTVHVELTPIAAIF